MGGCYTFFFLFPQRKQISFFFWSWHSSNCWLRNGFQLAMETSRQQPIDLEPFAWAHFSSRQLLFILRTADGVINNYGTGILRQAARLIETDLARSLESTCSGRQAKLNKYLCNFGSRQSDHSVISRCLCSVWHLSDLEVREVAIGAGGNADCCYYCCYVSDADLACLNDTWIRRLFLHVAPAWATALLLWSECLFLTLRCV